MGQVGQSPDGVDLGGSPDSVTAQAGRARSLRAGTPQDRRHRQQEPRWRPHGHPGIGTTRASALGRHRPHGGRQRLQASGPDGREPQGLSRGRVEGRGRGEHASRDGERPALAR